MSADISNTDQSWTRIGSIRGPGRVAGQSVGKFARSGLVWVYLLRVGSGRVRVQESDPCRTLT